ncbi:LOW QUALITY PROTEIN: hypothetical protein RJ639_028716 [Escallonia herrerae]|uniref:Uncharacterized protein n=1 Tax=Escallonia herrerae TaxID=1293975 RepID=A0AA89BPM2_9ASTE|nr:LOW QUALITY PROTEIN: hypothetical protein RJ639_028716 [Escallonia herrerae]
MSVCCGVECVLTLGFLRWGWKRCTYVGSDDSATWASATADEFAPVPRVCRLILAVYEEDLRNPQFPPAHGGYRLNPDWVVKRVTYEQTSGHAPPYLIYVDHEHREIVLAIRGLNLVKESDYKLLLDNALGMQMFDGGYVHHGLLKSAIWLLNQESDTLKRLWVENGSDYKMVFAGHSLGSGVAALLTVIVVNHGGRLGGVPRSKVRCYALAPARCMSLNLAVKYADVIHSVILQDDFLPRTPTPLEDIFKSLFWDTFIPEGRKLGDPRRLYAPGRMYHIVERKFCRCGRYPPEVRTAIPVDGRFEHIVLSCNATSDHGIIWIEREAEKALERLRESSSETTTTAPKVQKLERLKTLEKEHKDALERAFKHSSCCDRCRRGTHGGTLHREKREESSSVNNDAEPIQNESEDSSKNKLKPAGGQTNWNEVVEALFERNELGELLVRKDATAPK